MAGKSSSFSTTLILCGFCLVLGWSIGSRSTKKDTPGTVFPSANTTGPKTNPQGAQIPEPIVASTNDGTFIDFTKNSAELLEHSQTVADQAKRQLYLRKLLEHWINNDSLYPAEARDKFLAGMQPLNRFQNLGYETVFSYYVSLLNDSSIRNAWKLNYASHPARSEIVSQFLARDIANVDPVSLFQNSSHWSAWEKERYHRKVIEGWTQSEPNRAFAWYEANKSQFKEDTKNSIFNVWAHENFEGLTAHLDSILDKETRNSALDSLAKEMAFRGTDRALDWANSLSSLEDQDLAHDTIYRETPRGIGAVLKHEDGFPSVVEPLVPNGLEAGDLIVSAQNGDVSTDFYGEEIMTAINTLQGTPGTDVTVQVLRLDPSTGEYQQIEITITRQQLWMEKDHEP